MTKLEILSWNLFSLQAGDAHEEEEEEKSFFVFEGSTGGWKHATTGQMEDEENDKELYPELEQTAEEPEASDSNSSKKTTSSSLKEVSTYFLINFLLCP